MGTAQGDTHPHLPGPKEGSLEEVPCHVRPSDWVQPGVSDPPPHSAHRGPSPASPHSESSS